MSVQMISNHLFTSVMAMEILIIELIYAFHEEKRQYFWLRVFGCAVLMISMTIWIQFLYSIVSQRNFEYTVNSSSSDAVFKFLYYCLIFAGTIFCVKFCYRIPFPIVLFYCAAGYATQHTVVNIVSLLGIYIRVLSSGQALRIPFEILFCAIFYSLSGWLFMRKHYAAHSGGIASKIFLAFVVLLLCIGVSRFVNETQINSRTTRLAIHLYAIVSCVLVLDIFYNINENDLLKNRNLIFEEILEHDKRQYEVLKSSIEIINIKCHDMKHQLGPSHSGSSRAAQEISQAINDYDDIIETGSDVLNVLMTDKNMQCKKEDITFSCMMDGHSLAFLDELDMYSLLGNALSNAIEAAAQVRDPIRRCVSINSSIRSGMLLIHVENGYEGSLRFSDGVPQTSKDRTYHGYGMMSMQRTVEKYQGALTSTAEDGKFYLDLLLPVPEPITCVTGEKAYEFIETQN